MSPTLTDELYRKLQAGGTLVHDDLIIGGDYSQHELALGSIGVYSVVALSTRRLPRLTDAVNGFLKRRIQRSLSEAELHAAVIWNQSSRRDTPFCCLDTKERMKLFFGELSAIIAFAEPLVVAAVVISETRKPVGKELHELKHLAAYSALSRLDQNVSILTGRHLGRPEFFHDREERFLGYHVPDDPINPNRGMADIRAVPSSDASDLSFYRSMDPVYKPSDSRTHILIQIADIAAYFVGKHLRLREASVAVGGVGLPGNDCDFSRSMWDLLDVEAVLGVPVEHRYKLPNWLEQIVRPYDRMFDVGVDYCICSMRESIDRHGRPSGRSALGYLYQQTGRAARENSRDDQRG